MQIRNQNDLPAVRHFFVVCVVSPYTVGVVLFLSGFITDFGDVESIKAIVMGSLFFPLLSIPILLLYTIPIAFLSYLILKSGKIGGFKRGDTMGNKFFCWLYFPLSGLLFAIIARGESFLDFLSLSLVLTAVGFLVGVYLGSIWKKA